MPLQLSPITSEEYEKLAHGNPDFGRLVVKDFVHWRLYLNPNQANLYRSYVWLVGDHTDLQQRHTLTREQDEELSSIAWMIHRTLAGLSKPDMVNEFYAGNEYRLHRGHAHLHLIPRYFDPPTFNSERFPDLRFGRNYAPSPKLKSTPDMIEAIRKSLREGLDGFEKEQRGE